MCLLSVNRAYSQATLLADIGTYEGIGDNELLYLGFNPLANPPYQPEIIRVGGHLYISGRDPFDGFKIVRTDGTSDGAIPIKDIRTWNTGSPPMGFLAYNNLVYFTAVDETLSPLGNLWVTNGTPEGTRELYYVQVFETELVGDHLYWSGDEGLDIYKTDLNTGITNNVLRGPEGRDFTRLLTNVNGSLYFRTESGKLWKSDGTRTGTGVVGDFYSIKSMDALGDALLFRVVREDLTEELWRSEASTSTTSKLKTLHTGPALSAVSYPTATIGDTHYFVANDDIHGNELWKTRGTGASTSMVLDLNTNDYRQVREDDIRSFVVFENTLFFSAKKSDDVWSIFKTNGTASGTQRIIDVGPILYAAAQSDQFYFFTHESVDDSGKMVTALWKTDGTQEGSKRVYDFKTTNRKIHHKFVDGWLYFSNFRGWSALANRWNAVRYNYGQHRNARRLPD